MYKPHVDAYLRSKGKRSKKTAATYGTAIAALYRFAQNKGCDRLTTDAILDFHAHLLDTVTPSTAETYMAAVQGYIEFLEVAGEDVSHINRARIKYDVRNARRPQTFEHIHELDHLRKTEMPRLLDYFEHYDIPEHNDSYNGRLTALRDVAVFWTLYETAARIGEARRLNRDSIDRDRKVATVIGKGNKPHILRFIGDRALPAIDAYLAEREDDQRPLFISHSRNAKGGRLTTMSFHNVVKRAMQKTDIDERLTPHDLRHFRAITLMRGDVPMHVIQQFLNHSNIDTTRRFYAPITDEDDMLRHLSAFSA